MENIKKRIEHIEKFLEKEFGDSFVRFDIADWDFDNHGGTHQYNYPEKEIEKKKPIKFESLLDGSYRRAKDENR